MITAFRRIAVGLLLALSANGLLAAVPITPVPPQATLRVAAVEVRVVLDHRDWTYDVGEPVKFTISVMADNQPIDQVAINYTVGPELTPVENKTAVVPLAGLIVDGGTMQEPGFLRCTVSAEVAGRTYTGVATAAFAPEKIKPLQVDPADFDEFWEAERAKLAQIPLEPQLIFQPEASNEQVNVYHVSFRTLGLGGVKAPARVYGILCEPKAPGKYPAVLKVPGAGVRPYPGDKDLAARGVITLEIGVHGIPVNLPANVYSSLAAGALNGYWQFNFDDREKYYYHRVYLGCVRGNDFLTSRETWDGKKLIVMGASQGGQLSIVTAALDARVTGLAATHPAFCDVAAELQGRAGGWPHPFLTDLVTRQPSPHATPAKISTAAYYDTVNFARRLKVPGYYTWGYNDSVCPPTSTYAAYNVITAPKTLGVTLELAHSYTQEQSDAIYRWVTDALDVK